MGESVVFPVEEEAGIVAGVDVGGAGGVEGGEKGSGPRSGEEEDDYQYEGYRYAASLGHAAVP